MLRFPDQFVWCGDGSSLCVKTRPHRCVSKELLHSQESACTQQTFFLPTACTQLLWPLSVRLCLFIHLSICIPVYLSLSVYLSLCLSVYLKSFHLYDKVISEILATACLYLLWYSHAQSLAALQAYSHWLAQFCSEVQRQQDQTRFANLITSSMAATTPLISAKVLPSGAVTASLPFYLHWLCKIALPIWSNRWCCVTDEALHLFT